MMNSVGDACPRRRMWLGHTVDYPRLYLRGLYLECGRNGRVGDVAADILEAKGGESDEADFAFQLCAVELCGTMVESNVRLKGSACTYRTWRTRRNGC